MSSVNSPARHLVGFERFLLYGFVGLCVEVLFTALYEQVLGNGDVRLMGQTYLWMHPIWALGLMAVDQAAPLMHRRRWHWIARGLVWMLGSYAIEYSTGWVLRQAVGKAPWDYSHFAGNIDGLICLEYSWGWATCGLVAERITGLVKRLQIHRHPAPPASCHPTPPCSASTRAVTLPPT